MNKRRRLESKRKGQGKREKFKKVTEKNEWQKEMERNRGKLGKRKEGRKREGREEKTVEGGQEENK